jgi:hypothetical protein
MTSGGLHPEAGNPVTLTLKDGKSVNCSMENIYGGTNSCPRGWYGKADAKFCFKVFNRPETNVEACRYL